MEKLLDILQGEADQLLPVFCKALIKERQSDAVKRIRQNLEKQQQQQQLQQQQQSQGEPSTSLSFRCIF